MNKNIPSVVTIVCLSLITLSACSSGSNAKTDGSVTTKVSYTISDSDFARIQDEFNEGRFGFLYVNSGSGEYESWTGVSYDVCMSTVFIDDTPLASIIVLNAGTLNELCASFDIQFNSYDEWSFSEPRVLTKNPTYIRHSYSEDYSNMLLINGLVEDESGSFEFVIATRPWGDKWDDVANTNPEDLPSTYYDWYLPLIEAGEVMPI